jgi:uncharacterized protein YgiB involved in biofilm formation
MFRRQAILDILPKTTVHGFYRSDAFLIAFIPIVLPLLLFLPSCQNRQPSVSVKFYRTLQECVADRVLPQQCKQALEQAQKEHLQNGLSYPSRAECEQATQSVCEMISLGGKYIYKPIMQGFAVEQPQTGTAYTSPHTGIYISRPVYGYPSRYWLSDREQLSFSNDDRTATVTSPSQRSVKRGFGSSFKSSTGRSSGS